VALHRSPKPVESRSRIERVWIRANTAELRKLVFDLAHFRNLVLLFIHRYHQLFGTWITSASVLYTLLAKPNARSTRNPKKMQRIREILERAKGELWEFLEKAIEVKQRVGCKFVRQVIRQISKDFSNYFKALDEYKKNPEKFTGVPKPPKPRKLRNIRKFTVEFTKDMFTVQGRKVTLKLPSDEVTITMSKELEVTSIRLIYYLDQFYVDIVYDTGEQSTPLIMGNFIAAIDPNLDNLLAIVSTNPSLPSIIIDGRELKAFNQWFNKMKSKYQSEHDRILNEIKRLREEGVDVPEELLAREHELRRKLRALWAYRKKRLDDYFHKLSKDLAEFLYRTGHKMLVIGKGALEAKRNCSLSSKVAEKFVQIPFRRFIELLKYKCEEYGIRVIEKDEKYTSKACCLNDDIVRAQKNEANLRFTGKRIKRGLYRTVNPWTGKELLINADCNAAMNLLKLAGVDPTRVLEPKVLLWKLATPVRVRLHWLRALVGDLMLS